MTHGIRIVAAALALASGGGAWAAPGEITVGVGPVTLADGATLRLASVTDQRCPSEVECYWEGTKRAVLMVRAAGGGEERLVVLCNRCEDGEEEAVAAGWRLRLVNLEPGVEEVERLGREATVADYAARLTAVPAP